jgi:RNA polymerase sigma factor (sigma-70 family)
MNDDAMLLQRYADEGSEAAFAELVRRHVDLVHCVALRRTGGDAHAAADVAQQVFTKLARHARKLSRHTVLGAWLHIATRNAALDLMISEQRRRVRDRDALSLAPGSTDEGPADWSRVGPLLDAAVDELGGADREVVVLRFLQRKPFPEIAAALHLTEDAARMRSVRALDKLREILARRGVTSSSAALGAVISGQAVASAPAGLAATLAAQSLANAAAGLIAPAGVLFSLMNIKIVTSAVLGTAIGIGIGLYQGDQGGSGPAVLSSETTQESQLAAGLRLSNRALQAEVDRLGAEVSRLSTANANLAAASTRPVSTTTAALSPTLGWMPRYEQQRLIMGYLRQVDAARSQATLETGRAPSSIHELVGANRYIRTIRPVAGEDYSNLALEEGKPISVTTADGMTVTYDPSGVTTTPIEAPPEVEQAQALQAQAQQLARKSAAPRQQAIEAYRLANQGKDPPPQNLHALIPYFASPQDGADFVEFLEVQSAAVTAAKASASVERASGR